MSLVRGRRWLVLVCVTVTIGWSEVAAAQTLTVAWDRSPDPSVVGYIVYAGTESGQYTASFNVGAATSFTYGVTPDRQYFFAVASYAAGMAVGPLSAEVASSAPADVLLSDPGDQWSIVGSHIELQLFGIDSFGGTVMFSAVGLPPGLEVDSSTGRVSGTPTTTGTYVVTAAASDGVSITSRTFTWTIAPAPVDLTPPVVTITLPSISDRVLTEARFITAAGVAADANGIVSVSWTNSRGGSGTATGTDVWLAGVMLQSGRNDVTITAIDPSGNRGTATFSIYQQH